MSFENQMLQELANEMDIPMEEIESMHSNMFPSNTLERTSCVVVSTAFSKTDLFPHWHEKQSFERDFILKYISDHFGEPPAESSLRWTKNPHEFGAYCDMEYSFDDSSKEHLQFFDHLESIDSESIEKAIQDSWDQQRCKIIPLQPKQTA
ncbi:hypothetical protein [Reichenbachiella sp.]|uniref:hypothetical protein n=1 Tax=Reichenbachiella sp. TaxID=2184521 RepID=UPI0032653160